MLFLSKWDITLEWMTCSRVLHTITRGRLVCSLMVTISLPSWRLEWPGLISNPVGFFHRQSRSGRGGPGQELILLRLLSATFQECCQVQSLCGAWCLLEASELLWCWPLWVVRWVFGFVRGLVVRTHLLGWIQSWIGHPWCWLCLLGPRASKQFNFQKDTLCISPVNHIDSWYERQSS